MSGTVITVDNLSKMYTIGAVQPKYSTVRDHIVDSINSLFYRKNTRPICRDTIWALKNVSFDVKQGEVLGIIGRNGAGKSTLLKILSRITQPTSGSAQIRGRVGCLLEVGTGFHQELTGRENVYLNGAILGMKKIEIDRKFDEIVAFSEVAKFVDTAVKHYSSGMHLRLAFAVAAHLEPEILIVDEVLAVGDAGFQKKCLGKMEDVATRGRTVLFVSHSMVAVSNLCQNAIWIDDGNINYRGEARDVVQKYLADTSQVLSKHIDLSSYRRRGRLGQQLRLIGVEWLTSLPLCHSERVKVRLYCESQSMIEDVSVTVGFSTLEGTRLLSYDSDADGSRYRVMRGQTISIDFEIQDFPLPPGIYSLDVGSRSADTFTLDYIPSCGRVEVSVGGATPGYIQMGTGVRLLADCVWENGKSLETTNGRAPDGSA